MRNVRKIYFTVTVLSNLHMKTDTFWTPPPKKNWFMYGLKCLTFSVRYTYQLILEVTLHLRQSM